MQAVRGGLELIESIRIPSGREVTSSDFDAGFVRMRQALKAIEARKAFEEIRLSCGPGRRGALARAGRWIGSLTDADGRHGGYSAKLMNLGDSRAVFSDTPVG